MIRSLILVVHGLITMSLEQMCFIERIITEFRKIACSMFMLSTAIRTLMICGEKLFQNHLFKTLEKTTTDAR